MTAQLPDDDSQTAAYWERRAKAAWSQLDEEAAQRMALHSEVDSLRARLAAQQPVINVAEAQEARVLDLLRRCEEEDEEVTTDAIRAALSGSVEAADTPPSGTSGHEADTPAEAEPYVLCGDCRHCHPELYDGDDECGPECHPGLTCVEKRDFREVAGIPAAEPAPDGIDQAAALLYDEHGGRIDSTGDWRQPPWDDLGDLVRDEWRTQVRTILALAGAADDTREGTT